MVRHNGVGKHVAGDPASRTGSSSSPMDALICEGGEERPSDGRSMSPSGLVTRAGPHGNGDVSGRVNALRTLSAPAHTLLLSRETGGSSWLRLREKRNGAAGQPRAQAGPFLGGSPGCGNRGMQPPATTAARLGIGASWPRNRTAKGVPVPNEHDPPQHRKRGAPIQPARALRFVARIRLDTRGSRRAAAMTPRLPAVIPSSSARKSRHYSIVPTILRLRRSVPSIDSFARDPSRIPNFRIEPCI